MNSRVADTWAPVSVAAYDRGAERLLRTIDLACDPRACLAEQIESGLRATISLFVADPDLARLLALPPFGGGEEALLRQRRWLGRYGARLRSAAASQPPAWGHPPSLEATLLGGIATLISREVICGRSEQLGDLLPALLEFLLVYYLDPQEAGTRARAIRESPPRPQ